MEEIFKVAQSSTERAVRYKGVWYRITPKKYEPEKQTFYIAWKTIKEEKVDFFKEQREDAKLLYPLFRNE